MEWNLNTLNHPLLIYQCDILRWTLCCNSSCVVSWPLIFRSVDRSDLPLSLRALALCKLLDKRLFELQSERLRSHSCLCMDSFVGHPYCHLLKAAVRKNGCDLLETTALQTTSNLWCQQWAECPPMILLFESRRKHCVVYMRRCASN